MAERPGGQSPAGSLRADAHRYAEHHRTASIAQLRGQLPVICAGSTVIRRLVLESRDQTADELAGAIVDTTAGPALAYWFSVAWLFAPLMSLMDRFATDIDLPDYSRPILSA